MWKRFDFLWVRQEESHRILILDSFFTTLISSSHVFFVLSAVFLSLHPFHHLPRHHLLHSRLVFRFLQSKEEKRESRQSLVHSSSSLVFFFFWKCTALLYHNRGHSSVILRVSLLRFLIHALLSQSTNNRYCIVLFLWNNSHEHSREIIYPSCITWRHAIRTIIGNKGASCHVF